MFQDASHGSYPVGSHESGKVYHAVFLGDQESYPLGNALRAELLPMDIVLDVHVLEEERMLGDFLSEHPEAPKYIALNPLNGYWEGLRDVARSHPDKDFLVFHNSNSPIDVAEEPETPNVHYIDEAVLLRLAKAYERSHFSDEPEEHAVL
jgi:hypothetical protein